MNDEPRDDEILGRALARAIETQDVRETPFEESRMATPPRRSFASVGQFAAAAAFLVLMAATASWLQRPQPGANPVAASSSPRTSVGVTPATTAPPQIAMPVTSSAPRTQVDHSVVYFPRAGLPPIGVHAANVATQSTAEGRIASRVDALNNGSAIGSSIVVPQGAFNPFPLQDPRVLHVLSAHVSGDVATVDVALPPSGWSVSGAARAAALVQQLVYTITEEPGITRAEVLANGGLAKIDQFTWDRALSREDVFGYVTTGPVGADHAISFDGVALPLAGQSSTTTESAIGTSVKVTFDLAPGARTAPSFVVSMAPARDDLQQLGKYVLIVVIGDSKVPTSWQTAQVQIVDDTPLRATISGRNGQLFVEQLALDDARPWRAYTDGSRVIVEIGGDPRLVSDRIAVRQPVFDAKVGQTFVLSGSARLFEANVVWRVKDAAQKVVASGHTTATLGTSAVWGAFQTSVTLPSPGSAATGRLTLEVYEVSPKDGSEQGLVAIPVNP